MVSKVITGFVLLCGLKNISLQSDYIRLINDILQKKTFNWIKMTEKKCTYKFIYKKQKNLNATQGEYKNTFKTIPHVPRSCILYFWDIFNFLLLLILRKQRQQIVFIIIQPSCMACRN